LPLPSIVLFQMDAQRFAVLPFEGDGAAHRNGQTSAGILGTTKTNRAP
jgi:hypothetical protein